MRMGVRASIVLVTAVSALVSAAVILPADGVTGPSLGGCPMFPADNAWNQKVNTLALWSNSSTLIKNISSPGKTNLHADFGGNGAYGIPFKIVPATEPKRTIHYTAWGDESDPGPFPIPS